MSDVDVLQPAPTEAGAAEPEPLVRPPDGPAGLSYADLMRRLATAEARIAELSDGDEPSLVVPVNRTPTIDLTKPEDCPDQPDGEWSRGHLLRFLARQPRSVVFIPKENWEPKGDDVYQLVGYCGHWFRVRKGRPESVPIQIAEVIENAQKDFPTSQSQNRKRQLTDIRDLGDQPGSMGAPGVEVYLNR